jgi:hypothetical protein
MCLHTLQHGLGVLLPGEAAARELENDLAVFRQQLPERLGLEAADLVVAADDHGQHWRLDPADAPEQPTGAVGDGVVSGPVQADDPIGFVAATGRRVQRVVIGQRPEAVESHADRLAGQRVEPQAQRRFARTAGQLGDVAEDQLAIAAGIGGGAPAAPNPGDDADARAAMQSDRETRAGALAAGTAGTAVREPGRGRRRRYADTSDPAVNVMNQSLTR